MCFKKAYIIALMGVFVATSGYSQIYNTEVEAKISIEKNNEFIKVSGTSTNKTEISQSLRYVLSVIKTNPQNSNTSKNDQSGRLVLKPGETQSLSTTTINSDVVDKITILLLVYDVDDNLKGKDRIVINDDGSPEEEAPKSATTTANEAESNTSPDVDSNNNDGVSIRGIVVEDTKTKPGSDFYKMFYEAYNANNINARQIITIKEVLALGTNTKLEVRVADEVVFEFFARPNLDYLKMMSDAAIRRAYMHIQRLNEKKELVKRY